MLLVLLVIRSELAAKAALAREVIDRKKWWRRGVAQQAFTPYFVLY
jgi:hypothetical protein